MKKKILPEINTLGIEISGREEVLVCGCLGICFYSTEEVRLNIRRGELFVCGEELCLRWAGYGKISVAGRIKSLTFC